MRRYLTLAVLASLAWDLTARAEHATIDLRIFRLDPASGQMLDQAKAAVDQEPPTGGANARPLFKVKANEPLLLQFLLTNTYPHGALKDVGVRYFVVREEQARQKKLPDLTQDVVTQGRFQMHFRPKCRVGARVAFTIAERGVYLLRVDTTNTRSDHEHLSAIDLQVE